jgi:hypothetical protein
MAARPPRRPRHNRWFGLAVGCVLAGLLLPAVATATTWQVTNTSDGASTCPSAGSCTLRGAITQANSGGGADTVQVPAGHYTLAAAVPVTKAMQIVGPAGAISTEVQQLAAAAIFSVAASATDLTITGLSLTGAATEAGGAVKSSAAHLTLSGDVFAGNRPAAAGAGTYGAVQIDSSTPTTLTVLKTRFSSNRAGSDGTADISSGQGSGGAITFYSPGTLTVADSTFDANIAGGNGGAGVSSAQGSGGAIAVRNPEGTVTATVSGSTFTGNRSGGNGNLGDSGGQGDGGAISFAPDDVPGSALVITDSTFASNVAGGNGGGGSATGTGVGGAISLYGPDAGAALSITGSTFVGNRTGGAPGAGSSSGQGSGGALEAAGSGTLMLVNTTLSNNTALGGGIGGTLDTSVATTIVNSTLANGSAGAGGNINLSTASLTLTNTIVAGGSAAAGSNCAGAINSNGHNIEDANTCSLGAPGDHVGTAPALGPLASNGGPTQTMAPLPGSPAIDGGDAAGCPANDQRGALRPAGVTCDVGAFEIATPGATSGAASAITATSATLNGVAFNPDIAAASAYFEYGTTAAYGAQTAPQAVSAAATGAAVTAVLSGLAPGSAYHVRLVVTNAVGTAVGSDQTFDTFTTPPALRDLKVRPSRFRAQPGSGASIAKAKKRVRGATISYGVSQNVATTFTVQRPRKGFRSKGRCVAKRPSGAAKKLRRCTRYTKVGSFKHAGLAGDNRFRFTGRVKRKPLRSGRYRLRATARNGALQVGVPLTTTFRIVR